MTRALICVLARGHPWLSGIGVKAILLVLGNTAPLLVPEAYRYSGISIGVRLQLIMSCNLYVARPGNMVALAHGTTVIAFFNDHGCHRSKKNMGGMKPDRSSTL
jgi:hypothetical protein